METSRRKGNSFETRKENLRAYGRVLGSANAEGSQSEREVLSEQGVWLHTSQVRGWPERDRYAEVARNGTRGRFQEVTLGIP